MYCSLATNIGYQLGLHRPWCKADFEEDTQEGGMATTVEMKTWYGCFIVNTWYVYHRFRAEVKESLLAGAMEVAKSAASTVFTLLLTFSHQPGPQIGYSADYDARECRVVSYHWK